MLFNVWWTREMNSTMSTKNNMMPQRNRTQTVVQKKTLIIHVINFK